MQPVEITKSVSLKTESRKFLALPCLKAIIFGLFSQIILIGLFVILANFNIFQPISWLRQLFGFHWLKHVPLLGILLANGISLSKTLFVPRKYYPNRFKWLLDNGLRKLVQLTLQILLGVLTACSFMSYMRAEDGSLLLAQNGNVSLNSRYTFLVFMGLAGAIYQFMLNFAGQDVILLVEDIAKPTYIRLREALIKNLTISAKKALMPTLSFTLMYWICGAYINQRLAYLFNVALMEEFNSLISIFTNFKMLLYAWLLVTEIFTIMTLMQQTFSIFVTANYKFPIGAGAVGGSFAVAEPLLTLVGGLSMEQMPIVQQLAAFDFYNLTQTNMDNRRKEIFALSQPGGHPYNWQQLSSQCLSIINAYVADLSASIKSTPGMSQPIVPTSPFSNLRPSATELAQRILIHQYNEKHNIRRLKSDNHALDQNVSEPTSTVARINANFEQIVHKIKQFIIDVFKSVPGLYYMFGEPENAKTAFLLSNAELFTWLVQALASICAASLHEDPYGIVQLTLPEIMKTFLKLKIELDRLSSLSLSSKKTYPNLMPLRNALKRCLHLICNAFADYLPEIVEDTNDLPILRTFLYHSHKC